MLSSKVLEVAPEIKAHLFEECGVAQVGDTLFAVVDGELHQIEVPADRAMPLAQSDEPWVEGWNWDCGFGLLCRMYEHGLLDENDPAALPFRALYERTGGHNPTYSPEENALRDALAEILEQAAANGRLTVIRVQRRRRFFQWPGRSGNTGEDEE